MLKGDPDDVVLCKVRADGSKALADLICFVGLYAREQQRLTERQWEHGQRGSTYLLTVSGKSVLYREDGNGVHGELMGSTEDTDSDFLQCATTT